jgi:hypothetical protein
MFFDRLAEALGGKWVIPLTIIETNKEKMMKGVKQ